MPMSNTAKRLANHPTLTGRGVLALVAAGWGAVEFLTVPGGPETSWTAYLHAGALTALLAGLAVCAWIWNKWSGAAAVAAAVVGAWLFNDAPHLALMAAPLALGGVLLLWHGGKGKSKSSAPAAAPVASLDDDDI
ncbi:MAG: hypothetical protein DHS20C14_04310 [Phycisphaeraceae bacterium]|nr:MAG: hypothetical protein DHS20C14_04310 [Phycisphaeraceae bacterium]